MLPRTEQGPCRIETRRFCRHFVAGLYDQVVDIGLKADDRRQHCPALADYRPMAGSQSLVGSTIPVRPDGLRQLG